MAGVETLTEASQRDRDTTQVTLTTNQITANSSVDFKLDGNDSAVDSISYKPTNASNLKEGLIMMIRVVATGSSTDTDLTIYEDNSRDAIDEVIRLTGISVNDGTTTIQPGTGDGVQYQNQQDDSQIYLSATENSNNPVTLELRIRWFDVT